METKVCKLCKETKPLTEYFKDKGFKDGHCGRCKTCKTKQSLQSRAKLKDKYNEYMRTYRKTHPKKYETCRNQALRSRYGITQEQYEQMLKDQDGTCAICPVTSEERLLHVDHCHTTGKVRGLLCAGHNRSIAILDDPALLAKANLYLKR